MNKHFKHNTKCVCTCVCVYMQVYKQANVCVYVYLHLSIFHCASINTCAGLCAKLACVTLLSTMSFSLPGFSIHGDSPDKNTGVGCHSLLQGIFQTQELNTHLLCILDCQAGSLQLKPLVSSVQSLRCVRLCDPMDCSMPGFPVHHQLLKLAQIQVH